MSLLENEITKIIKTTTQGVWESETVAIYENDTVQVQVIVTKDKDEWLEEVTPLFNYRGI